MPVKSKRTPGKKKVIQFNKKPKTQQMVSHTTKPGNFTDAQWQRLLRVQVAEKEGFTIKNIGVQPLYSDYSVYSPKSKNTYKVALRSKDDSLNFCSCLDFKTNQLGTCKHIEAVRISTSKKRGIKNLIEEVPVLSYTSIYISYKGERTIRLRIGSDNEKEFKEWASKYFDAEYRMRPDACVDMEQLLLQAYQINSSFRCYDDALAMIVEKRDSLKRERLIKNEADKLLNGLVTAKLFPYQKEGILFAARAGRAILADDMGLGKTVQAISWAILMQKLGFAQKAIIICPTSLKYQWKTEIEKFTDATVKVIEGNILMRKDIYETDDSYFKIVSYHMAGNDCNYINQMHADIVILDEAQRIKNWRAKISHNIKRIQSPYALILTGTPLENNIEELYSLVQYINPFLLGSLHHFLTRHQVKHAETGKVTGYSGLNEIGHQLSGLLLRRTKKEVLKQLPERMDKNLFVPLTLEQRELHTEYSNDVAKIVNKWKRFGFLNEQDRQRMLNCLNMMRMVCDSTFILDQKTNYQTKLDELFNILDELLQMKEEKVVIFSQWERMTRLIAAQLTEREIKFESLHGGVPSKKREALFTNFNNDSDCRIFLSTDAGGVGLNLQAASYLINMDIPWNPAVLEQRIARIYRMGQKKNVSIINLVAQDTIEQRMLSVLKFKSSIAAGILDNGEDSIFLGDDRFKAFMESVEAITQDKPAEIISFDMQEKNEIAPVNNRKVNDEFSVTGMLEDEPIAENGQVKKVIQMEKGEPTQASLVQNGISFFSQLINTLSDQKAVENLVESITETDEKTGQTWLKLPVENKEIVEKAINLLSGFLNSTKK